MAVKDKRGNNIRAGERVKDDFGRTGVVISTNEPHAIVQWDDGEGERVEGIHIHLAKKRLGQ
jgi:hypothetical protein